MWLGTAKVPRTSTLLRNAMLWCGVYAFKGASVHVGVLCA